MSWSKVEKQITNRITKGVDLNSVNTRYRIVLSVSDDVSSTRYGYNQEKAFLVQIGKSSAIPIPISMIRTCYGALSSPKGYSGDFFREHFPRQAQDHPWHVHVVGQVLVAAGLARRVGGSYRLIIRSQ